LEYFLAAEIIFLITHCWSLKVSVKVIQAQQ
jgi:hypothetical protein